MTYTYICNETQTQTDKTHYDIDGHRLRGTDKDTERLRHSQNKTFRNTDLDRQIKIQSNQDTDRRRQTTISTGQILTYKQTNKQTKTGADIDRQRHTD